MVWGSHSTLWKLEPYIFWSHVPGGTSTVMERARATTQTQFSVLMIDARQKLSDENCFGIPVLQEVSGQLYTRSSKISHSLSRSRGRILLRSYTSSTGSPLTTFLLSGRCAFVFSDFVIRRGHVVARIELPGFPYRCPTGVDLECHKLHTHSKLRFSRLHKIRCV